MKAKNRPYGLTFQSLLGHENNTPSNMVSEPSVSQSAQLTSYDPFTMVQMFHKTYSGSNIHDLQQLTGLNNGLMASIMHISERTLQRFESTDTLPTDQAERFVLLTMLFMRGEEIFSSVSAFKQWLFSPSTALNDATPFSFLDTVTGFSIINDELTRLEHGVFS